MKLRTWILAGLAALALGIVVGRVTHADNPATAPMFARTTIDLGMVVSDIEKSAAFYTKAIGFKEIKGFDVPADMAADAGLTDKKAFSVRVFVLGEGETATKLKLIQFPGSKPAASDTAFIENQLGVRYLTLFTSDTNAALKRLTDAGAKPIAKGPVPLPKGFPEGVFLTVVRDPDGNLVELVGPKK